MYTPGQVSTMLSIPVSSLRRYAKIFADYLSPGAKRRKRQYSDDDVLVLKRIRELAGNGMTTEEIKEVLTLVPQEDKPPDSALALMPTILEEFETLRRVIMDQQDYIDRQRVYNDQVRKYNKLSAWQRLRTPPPEPPE